VRTFPKGNFYGNVRDFAGADMHARSMFHADMGRPFPDQTPCSFLALRPCSHRRRPRRRCICRCFIPVSTNSSPDAHANLALSIFQSRIGELDGIALHPLVSEVSGPASGLQVTGAFRARAGIDVRNPADGGVASVHESMKGLQASGIGNFVRGDARGIPARRRRQRAARATCTASRLRASST
jgi:hypothetical protein